ncbi:MAG: acyltransferase, partial [Actinobacteria bacterium]|nr:acyltransferase [Actinomycetota bacterium]
PVTLLLLGWLFARTATGRIAERPRALVAAIAVLGSGSFALAMWQTAANRDAAYFNTFGRVWEFMLGGLIAAGGPAIAAWLAGRERGHAATPHRGLIHLRGVAQLLGYAAVFSAAALFTADTSFPGPWALLPAAGTALIIASGPQTPQWSPTRALERRPVQYLGDISYSLYLWHWPLIVFAPFALERTIRLPEKLLILLLSVLLAALSKRFVEDPGRTRLFAGAQPRRPLLATVCSAAVVGAMTLGVGGWAGTIETQRADAIAQARESSCFGAGALDSGTDCGDPFGPALFPSGGTGESPWAARNAPECAEAPESQQILSGDKPSLVQCDFTEPQGEAQAAAAPRASAEPPAGKKTGAKRSGTEDPLNVWLVGDSHAEHWQAAVIDLARGNRWQLTRVAYGGCPTVPVSLARFENRSVTTEKRASCLKWSEDVNERIKEERPDVVLVSNFASAERVDDGSDRPEVEQLADGIRQSLLGWTKRGTEVVVIRDTPTGGEEMGADCSATRRAQTDRGCIAPKAEVLPKDPMVQAVKMLDRPGLGTVNLSSAFCADDTCSGVVGGVPVYYDEDHLAASYSRSLAPVLGDELGEKLDLELSDPVPESKQ